MRFLALAAAAACMFGSADFAQAQQQGGRLFFEGDIVRGAQQGAPGPACVLNGQFKRLEKVVWRLRVLDKDGKPLDDKGLKGLIVELPDGQKFNARYSQHPPRGEPTDHFWTAAWIIPTGYPSGTFVYKVTAIPQDGAAQTWEPFKVKTSQFAVVDGEVEIKKTN